MRVFKFAVEEIIMKQVFVCGVFSENSGKTTLCRALIEYLASIGVRVSAFKPLSGHSFWEQYDCYLECLRIGSIFCEDAYELWKLVNVKVPIEVLNPADILTTIPDIIKLIDKNSINNIFNSTIYNWMYVGRFTIAHKGELEHIVYYNVNEEIIHLDEIIRKLKIKISKLIPINEFNDFMKVHEEFYYNAVNSCYELISKNADLIVVEGFNDSIYPWSGVENSTIVLAVSPGHIIIYNAKEFYKAINNQKTIKVFYDVASKVKPIKILRIPPLTKHDIKDTTVLARKYSNALAEIVNILKL